MTGPSAVRSVSRMSWLIPVLFAWASLFSLGIIDNSRGPVFLDILNEFAVSDTLGSLFFFLSSFASVVHNLALRKFLAETPPLRLVGIYTLVMAGGSLIAASANSYWVLLTAAFVLGVGFGGVGVGQNAAVQEAPAKYRGRSLGLLHAMYGTASFLAPLIVATLQPHGWRLALFVAALPAVFVGLAVVGRLGIERFRGWSRKRKAETPVIVDNIRGPNESPESSVEYPGSHPSTHPDAHIDKKMSPEARARAAKTAAFLVAFLVVAEISVSSRLSLLARREWGVSAESASSWLAAYFAAMTIARFSLGFLPSVFSAAKVLRFTSILNLPFLLVAFVSVVLPASSQLPSEVRLLALVGFGFPIAVGYPMVMTRIAEIFGRETQKVTGRCVLYQAGAAMLMHFVLGTGADAIGLEPTLAAVAVVSAFGALISLGNLERAVLRSS